MPCFRKPAVSALAALALVQFCPAPFLLPSPKLLLPASVPAPLGRSVEISGGSADINGDSVEINNGSAEINDCSASRIQQRQQHNQQAWKFCRSQLGSATINFSAPKPGRSPSCLYDVGQRHHWQVQSGNPIPMGSDSVLFQNLSNQDILEIQAALDARR
ncbi:hypothetical protein DL770_009918 [Monosporascus sp. CRB-9-2]|nr:hypothetical protein DL770_009918 [Monosporascus sp. CRB-9-2]